MPVSVTYNNEFPYSNMTDDSLSEELSPENHAQGGQTTALDIVLDTDHLDYSVLRNVDPDYNKSVYNFKGYSHIYKLRDKKRGGGVSMFINNKLNIQVRNDITFNLKNIDLIAVKILKDELNTKRNVIIITIYRPPDVLSNLFNDTLNDLLQMLNQENKNMFVAGDFNINTSDAIINPNINVNNFQHIFYLIFIHP